MKNYNKSYYEKNKDKIKEAQKRYYQKTKEQRKQYNKGYQKKNLDKFRAGNKRYYEKYGDKIKKRHKEYNLKRTYGIDIVTYNKLLESQNYKCPVCGDVLISPHLDHNHTTGVIRGILCQRCNMAMGLLKEDIKILNSMINYISRSGGPQ